MKKTTKTYLVEITANLETSVTAKSEDDAKKVIEEEFSSYLASLGGTDKVLVGEVSIEEVRSYGETA
jgi:hypothetical protein